MRSNGASSASQRPLEDWETDSTRIIRASICRHSEGLEAFFAMIMTVCNRPYSGGLQGTGLIRLKPWLAYNWKGFLPIKLNPLSLHNNIYDNFLII